MKTKILTSLFVLCILIRCSPEEPARGLKLHIEGEVTDAVTGNPIEGIFITLRIWNGSSTNIAKDTQTNHDGKYVLRSSTECVYCGYSVVASSLRYNTTYIRVLADPVIIRLTDEIQVVNFQLKY